MVYYDGHNTDIGNKIYPYFILFMVVSICIMYPLTSHKIVVMMKKMGGSSFFIFASHMFVLKHISWLINKAFAPIGTIGDIIAYLLIPLLTIAFCIIIYRMMQQYMPKFSKILGCI